MHMHRERYQGVLHAWQQPQGSAGLGILQSVKWGWKNKNRSDATTLAAVGALPCAPLWVQPSTTQPPGHRLLTKAGPGCLGRGNRGWPHACFCSKRGKSERRPTFLPKSDHAWPAITRRTTLPSLPLLQEFNLISSRHSSLEAFPFSSQSFHRQFPSLCSPQPGHRSGSLRFFPGKTPSLLILFFSPLVCESFLLPCTLSPTPFPSCIIIHRFCADAPTHLGVCWEMHR